jgi:hypothetical protein
VQTGSDNYVAVDYPTGEVLGTSEAITMDMTKPFYFRFTQALTALYTVNCIGHPGFCSGQALYSTHTAEILEFNRPS